MKKFKTASYHPIEIVEIDRETDSNVWINGRRHNKLSSYECYFGSFQEAKDHVVSEATKTVVAARRQLEYANGRLGNAKGMKDPSQ